MYSATRLIDDNSGALLFPLDEPPRPQHSQQQRPATCDPSSREAFDTWFRTNSAQHTGIYNNTYQPNRDTPSSAQSVSSRQTCAPPREPNMTTSTLPSLGGYSLGAFATAASFDQVLTPRRTAAAIECRYPCLYPLLPFFGDRLPAPLACDLFDVYLVDPGTSLFRRGSPFIMTRIFRKKALLHPTNPRQTSPALLATILWCCAQTADLPSLLVPGFRSKLTDFLYELAGSLVNYRDLDRWRRIPGRSFPFQHLKPGLAG